MDPSIIPALYQPLSVDRKEIRVLEIIGMGDKVSCNLRVVSLNDNPSFTALSYVWGDANDKVPFTVDGRPVQITRSLAAALRHAKEHWQKTFPDGEPDEFRLWADALCINQGDLAERASQVQLMRDIYRSASLVISWMGHKDADMISLALSTISEIHSVTKSLTQAEFSTLQWMQPMTSLLTDSAESLPGQNDIRNEKWAALHAFFQSEYFTRVWVFQEMLLGNKVILACPSHLLAFDIVARVCENFAEVQRNIRDGHAWLAGFIDNQSTASSMILFGINFATLSWLRIGRQIVREHPREECWVISPHGNNLKATDPRDHVYGLLGVANVNIVPDYSPTKTLGDVYADYVAAWLETARTKDPGSWEVTSVKDRLALLPQFCCHGDRRRSRYTIVGAEISQELHLPEGQLERKRLPSSLWGL